MLKFDKTCTDLQVFHCSFLFKLMLNWKIQGAGPSVISHGNFKAQSLWEVTNPYILRRTKVLKSFVLHQYD